MKISSSFLLAVIFSLFFISCSTDSEVVDPESFMPGIWKPVTKEYLDSTGQIHRTLTDDESDCLRNSRWSFTENLFQLQNLEDREDGGCERNPHKQEGFWRKIEDTYYLFYSGELMISEAFEILHLGRDKMTLKLMGTSIYADPIIMTFEKVTDEATVIVTS